MSLIIKIAVIALIVAVIIYVFFDKDFAKVYLIIAMFMVGVLVVYTLSPVVYVVLIVVMLVLLLIRM